MTTVSVIVCTRDRPADFARLLPSLLASTVAPREIIVVDQSSSEATEHIVRAAQATETKLVYHRSTERGLSRARNAGIRLAIGDVCAFTDDDCTVSPDWVGWAQRTFDASPEIGLAFGALAPAPHDHTEEFVPAFQPKRQRWTVGRDSLLESGAGANMCIRRDVFDRVGPFDEALGAGGRFRSGEDSDYAYRVARAGYVVVHDAAGVVVHWGARPWAGGAARRLIFDGYAAIGTICAKHARRGDWLAVGELLRVAVRTCAEIVSQGLRSGRPVGVRRLSALARGAWDGWRFPFAIA